MKPRITFLHTPKISWDQNYEGFYPPLWAYTLAAHVPTEWSVEIVDCTFQKIDNVGSSSVFAFSGKNQDIDTILTAHGFLKSIFPSSIFIIGGPITWSLEQEGKLNLLQEFDSIFILDGEQALPDFLRKLSKSQTTHYESIVRPDRFPLAKSRPIRYDLFRPNVNNYYGAVIEVSRGCPFLCEFCDIRVLPGNNKSHNKPVELIIEELDAYWRLGVTQFQFACDNFIGDLTWARSCVDSLIEWKSRVKANISIFTWLTINLYKAPDLMIKMREAGFSILMIGIESVNQNSLLETAKVQNRTKLLKSITTIQSYGFIVAPGLIFGFDSDNENMFRDTLKFLNDSGTISGAPSFLVALPGTPLYERMASTGRLINDSVESTTRNKISTNIRYLQDSNFLTKGYLDYINIFTHPNYQLELFTHHLELLSKNKNYINASYVGYGSPKEYLKVQISNPVNRRFLLRRLMVFAWKFLIRNPSNLIALFRGWLLLRRYSIHYSGLGLHFNYWVYVWANIVVKHQDLKQADFHLDCVDEHFDYLSLVQDLPLKDKVNQDQGADQRKASHQVKFTNQALSKLAKGT